ncbi:hypothetical protein AMJ80_07295 [bacterium SM23_31]|nr:MAG: hypothetical protein AMJ80_07295 [bacterium SM23_31]
MKRYYLIIIAVSALALALGCSKSPVNVEAEDVLSEQEAEFKAMETDFASIVIDEEPDSSRTIGERRIERLRFQLRRMNLFLERLGKYEEKYPNEEAHKLIRLAKRYLNAAIKAYQEEKYRECYRYLKNARENAREALILLKPRNRYRNRNGG